MAAEICPGTQRHRAILVRSEAPLPRAPDLHRYRSSRPRHPSGYCRHEPGAPITYVDQPTNRCLERIGIKIVVYPQEILAATVHAVRSVLGGLKGGVKPPMASPAELATAIRSADYLARGARGAERG